VKHIPHAGDYLSRQHRMPAQLHKIVINTHTIQLQYACPYFCKFCFHFMAGWLESFLEFRSGRIRSRKSRAIEFRIRSQGQRIKQDESRRNHVLGKPVSEKASQVRQKSASEDALQGIVAVTTPILRQLYFCWYWTGSRMLATYRARSQDNVIAFALS